MLIFTSASTNKTVIYTFPVESLKNLKSLFKRENLPNRAAHGRVVPGRLRVTASDEGAQMSGHLHMRANTNKNNNSANSGKYKRLWFVLKDRVLYAYRAPEDTAASDTYPVLGFDLDLVNEVGNVSQDDVCNPFAIAEVSQHIGY